MRPPLPQKNYSPLPSEKPLALFKMKFVAALECDIIVTRDLGHSLHLQLSMFVLQYVSLEK